MVKCNSKNHKWICREYLQEQALYYGQRDEFKKEEQINNLVYIEENRDTHTKLAGPFGGKLKSHATSIKIPSNLSLSYNKTSR
mmetsp:Transcript_8633/g.12288  ORF Transcript_8633/g.12288 Transcript_8633/m.12288 type:complete len:83 (+) Transcript_8633:40-288(+)